MVVLFKLSDLSSEPNRAITIILITLVTAFLAYYKFRISPLLGKKLPPGSLGLPLIGETISFVRAHKHGKIYDWIPNHVNKYGPVFKTSVLGSNAVVLTGQAGNRFIFSGGDIASNQIGAAADIFRKHSIFELPGPPHKIVRGAVMNFLKPESIQRFVWTLFYNRLNTNVVRVKKKMGDPARWLRCLNDDEMAIHLFRDCPFAKEVWKRWFMA